MNVTTKNKLRSFFTTHRKSKFASLVAAVVVLIAGYVLIITYAAGFFAVLEFENASVSGATKVTDSRASGGSSVQFGSGTPAPAPPPPAPTPPPPAPPSTVLPTPQSTGPRVSTLTSSGSISSSSTGQVIERRHVTGQIVVKHDNVVVRDVKVNGTGTYMITSAKKSDGACPVNVRFEHIEIDGALAAENDIPIYSACGNMTIDHAYIHNVGRSSRVTNNMTISNSYIYSDRTGSSGAHRGAVGNNGGTNNRLINNVLKCKGTGCSAAMPMYGDFAPINGYHIEGNLLATTGSYCAYGGSLPDKPYPHGSNIKFINNRFSTEFFPTCGRYGHISGFANNVRGNEWRGNVWHETGAALNP